MARKVAELAKSANGKVNIALFGPWGAGKSSFNELLKEELKVIDPKARHITFDAWKNAGEGFRTNFLSELARPISKPR
nr:P-loop NTPase fold protein [Microbacterium rhizomatis]